jgi:hypothetical protein
LPFLKTFSPRVVASSNPGLKLPDAFSVAGTTRFQRPRHQTLSASPAPHAFSVPGSKRFQRRRQQTLSASPAPHASASPAPNAFSVAGTTRFQRRRHHTLSASPAPHAFSVAGTTRSASPAPNGFAQKGCLGFATGCEARLCLAVRLRLRVGYAPRSGSAHGVLWAKGRTGGKASPLASTMNRRGRASPHIRRQSRHTEFLCKGAPNPFSVHRRDTFSVHRRDTFGVNRSDAFSVCCERSPTAR